MTSDEIRNMFLFAAQAGKLPDDDPRKDAASSALREMKNRYVSENIGQPPPKPRPTWKSALQYVAALFSQMDAVDPVGREERAAAWEIISAAVTGRYANEAETPEPEK